MASFNRHAAVDTNKKSVIPEAKPHSEKSRSECNELLISLKGTVEGLLSLPSNNVWNMYGGLDRLRRCVEDILNHKQILKQGNTNPAVDRIQSTEQLDYWSFISGLRWLNPVTAPYIDQISRSSNDQAERCRRWLVDTLAALNLSNLLTTLVNCRHHLLQHYDAEAYLCQPDYFTALLICLRAVERNQPALLADVNPIKLMQGTFSISSKSLLKRAGHRRSASLPLPPANLSVPHSVRGDPAQDLGPLIDQADLSPSWEEGPDLPPPLPKLYHVDGSDTQSTSSYRLVSGVERVNDPLMNFYATSSVERCHDLNPSVTSSQVSLNQSTNSGHDLDMFCRQNHDLVYCNQVTSGHDLDRQNHDLVYGNQVTSGHDLICSNDLIESCDTLVDSVSLDSSNQTASVLESKQNNSGKQKHRDEGLFKATNGIIKSSELEQNKSVDDELEDDVEEFTSLLQQSNTINNKSSLRFGSVKRLLGASESLDSILNHEEDSGNPGNGVIVDSGFNSSISDRSNSVIGERCGVNANNSVKHKLINNNNQHSNAQNNEPISNVVKQEDSTPVGRLKGSHHIRSMSDFNVKKNDKPQSHGDAYKLLCSSLPTDDFGQSGPGMRLRVREGGGYFLRPLEGQSLTSFLSSQDFHTCTDLDRENAHFSIAEALIAAIEYMKWNQMLSVTVTDSDTHMVNEEEYESDEEIQRLKQRIRVRRTERFTEKAKNFPGFLDHVEVASSTSDRDPSSFESLSQDSKLSSSSSDRVNDTEIGEEESELRRSNAAAEAAAVTAATATTEATAAVVIKPERNNVSSSVESSMSLDRPGELLVGSTASADSIALALLKRFSSKQLPKASELVWLVSELDAPQKHQWTYAHSLLPLPESYPVSPEDGENSDLMLSSKQNRLRGNLDWAPPRAQIISVIHPSLRQKEVLNKQNNRCAGCGSKVEPGLLKRYQYCEYLGKYFCACCHVKDRAYIPGRILRRWDFSKYQVSRFAFDLLKRIYDEPLFSVEFLLGSYVPGSGWTKPAEGGGSKRVKVLEQMYIYRLQLYHLLQFSRTCTSRDRPQSLLDQCPSHWFNDLSSIHIYSLSELVQVKKNEFLPRLKELVSVSIRHVQKCVLCRAKGFICEICGKDSDIIFPFELDRVSRCLECRTCFHLACFTDMRKCPKCARIECRRKAATDTLIEEEEDVR